MLNYDIQVFQLSQSLFVQQSTDGRQDEFCFAFLNYY